MITISEYLERQYRVLQNKIGQLKLGECSAADVKKLSAPFGIYAEKDGRYMMRVRRLNGEINPDELENTAAIMSSNGIVHAHFSTRCNMQLHGVPPENVYKTLVEFGSKDMVFKGGGGNTFRSVAGSPYAGVSRTELFDTTPYMQAVWEYIFNYDKAFCLGRKFKMAFSAEAYDEANCGVQDLGLMAAIQDGQRGFRVYGGGGLGRGGVTALELLPFLPAGRVLQAVTAAIELFSDHGDRKDRSKARLRFVRKTLGDDIFRNLYLEYLAKSNAPLIAELQEVDYQQAAEVLVEFDTPAPESEEYRGWLERSVRETKFQDVVSVRLYIRKGVFKPADLLALAAVLRESGSPCIRLTRQQDVVIPLVHKSALPLIYTALTRHLNEQAVTDGSFSRHIVSCIGSSICKMGLVDSSAAADKIALALDDLFKDYQEIRDAVFEDVIDGIRISGCGSSCGVNQIAAIGLNGHRKNIDGVITDIFFAHIGGKITGDRHLLALSNPEWWIKVADAPGFTANIVKEYLDNYRTGNHSTLREFMLQKRDNFDPAKYL